jgi:hypothetical protein
MSRGTTQVESAREEIRELNERFRNGALLGKSFHAQLRLHGCDPSRSVLVALVPDGANTYSGQIIKQDGSVLAFDVDLDSPDLSRWEDCTREFEQQRLRIETSKPWAPSVVAYELFHALMERSPPEKSPPR